MSIVVKGLADGQIRVVERGSVALDGRLAGDTYDGLLAWSDEQSVLASDNPLLATPIPTARDPDPTHSWFRSTRVAAGATCAEIAADADALFAR